MAWDVCNNFRLSLVMIFDFENRGWFIWMANYLGCSLYLLPINQSQINLNKNNIQLTHLLLLLKLAIHTHHTHFTTNINDLQSYPHLRNKKEITPFFIIAEIYSTESISKTHNQIHPSRSRLHQRFGSFKNMHLLN